VARTLAVLVVEDNADDASLALRELGRAGFEVTSKRVETATGLRAALAERPWDVCLCDYALPGFDAPQALAIVRASGARLPFIVVSGAIGEETAVALMRAGADDYLLKGHLARLGAAVGRAVDSAAALDRSESRIEAILRGIKDGVVTADADGTIVYFSIGAERIFGHTAAEVIGTPVGRLVPERFRATHREHERQFTRPDGMARHVEHPAMLVGLRKSGEEFPIESVISRIDAGGESLATVVIRDISDRVRAEAHEEAAHEHLRRSEARFVDYFSASPVPSAIERLADRVLLEVNDACAQLLGYSRAELLGSDPYRLGLFVDPAEVRRLASTDPATAAAGGPWQGELTVRTKLGAMKRVMTYVRPLSAMDDPRIAISFVDLTERDRISALERHQLVLEEAARVKATFIASMNHELRTPLNAILGFSKLLLEQLDLAPKHRRYLENVVDAGNNLLALIGDVLDIARLESGKVVLRAETISLSGLLDPIAAAARLGAEAKGLAFTTAWPDSVLLWVDPTRVREILQNLLSNAIKFTAPGGTIALRVRTEGADLALEVTDTGLGIAPEFHDRVFHTFERFHERVVSEPGTGLGLALVKQLVGLHGGTVGFESAVGVGTVFRVRLPMTVAPLDRPGSPVVSVIGSDLGSHG